MRRMDTYPAVAFEIGSRSSCNNGRYRYLAPATHDRNGRAAICTDMQLQICIDAVPVTSCRVTPRVVGDLQHLYGACEACQLLRCTTLLAAILCVSFCKGNMIRRSTSPMFSSNVASGNLLSPYKTSFSRLVALQPKFSGKSQCLESGKSMLSSKSEAEHCRRPFQRMSRQTDFYQ